MGLRTGLASCCEFLLGSTVANCQVLWEAVILSYKEVLSCERALWRGMVWMSLGE